MEMHALSLYRVPKSAVGYVVKMIHAFIVCFERQMLLLGDCQGN